MLDGLQAKNAMRDSPVGLADVALPTLGALGGFALTEAHDWPGEWSGMVIASEASQGPQSRLCASWAAQVYILTPLVTAVDLND